MKIIPNNENLEWNRQLFHIFLGLAIVALLMFGVLDKGTILIILIFGITLSLLCQKTDIPVIHWLLSKFERQEDINNFPGKGTIFYFGGVYASLALFEKDIALASIMVLALGDSISHIYGKYFGKIRHPFSDKKFLEGSIAGFIFGFIGALVFARWYEAIIGSFIAMVVEGVDIKIGFARIDDNLTIPIAAGAAIWALRLVLFFF
ncbi:MAG TPA: SEC59/DGK1/VTE5 family protein [Candidatus Nanoarchaeia archaeon]|nr:SEC59/DGK1/VTE5 family protein [Candidatus Nanoarchaeia archaeon]